MTLDEKAYRVYEVLMAGNPKWKTPDRNYLELQSHYGYFGGRAEKKRGRIDGCIRLFYHSTGKQQAFG